MRRIVLIYIVITILFFGMLIKMEYATDTYSVFNFNKEQIYIQYASSGRFITALVGSIIKVIKVPENIIYFLSYTFAIIFTVLSQVILYKTIDIKLKLLKILIPTLIIINPFSIELFLFIEKGVMCLAVLLCILAVSSTKKYLETKNAKFFYISLILMFLANCSYQGVVGIYISIAVIYVLKNSKNILQFIKNNLITGVIYGLPALTNIIMVKFLFRTNRLSGKIDIIQSLKKINENITNMIFKTYDILPRYMLILAILFTFACFCSKIIKDRKKIFPQVFYIIFVCIIASILPQIFQPTESIWLVPRATYCFGALVGIIMLYMLTNYELKQMGKMEICLIAVIILSTQLARFINIEKDRYILNEKDEIIANEIVSQISHYEEITHNKIDSIMIYQDAKPEYTYPKVFATGDMNVKAFMADWSTEAIIKYYLKRNLKKIEIKDNKVNQDWNEFSSEQIKLEDNVLKIINY